ncbi:hypothetical protein ACP4OV_012309 [Aristida adscensionis]
MENRLLASPMPYREVMKRRRLLLPDGAANSADETCHYGFPAAEQDVASEVRVNLRQRELSREPCVRLQLLLTTKDSAIYVPTNLEARRRMTFFANSLFMKMPRVPPVRSMMSFSVLTPCYKEEVQFSPEDLYKKNEDGISILFYQRKNISRQIALYMGPTRSVGGLLNATCGNATELIIALFALMQGKIEVVKCSLIGSILSNHLLVLGNSLFCGGVANLGNDQPSDRGTVFAYGQTNSGKTYTMRGSTNEPGITLLAVYDLFRTIQEIEHHNIVEDMMLKKAVTYRPVAPIGVPKDSNMVAEVTIGFVKDVKHHIDVQGFNVYHQNRLIKPFWRVWTAARRGGRGVIELSGDNAFAEVDAARSKLGMPQLDALQVYNPDIKRLPDP